MLKALEPKSKIADQKPAFFGTQTGNTGTISFFHINTGYGELWIDWKTPTSSYVTPFRFTAKELDRETGLYYFGARYLDPRTSRWLSVDPAMYQGDYIPVAPNSEQARKHNQNLPGQGGIFNYVNMHVYHYAGNNPIKYRDPDGRFIDNGDGTFTAEQGDTLFNLYGDNWQEMSGFDPDRDPRTLQIGEVVGIPNQTSTSTDSQQTPITSSGGIFQSWRSKKDGETLTSEEARFQMAFGTTQLNIGVYGGIFGSVALTSPAPFFFGIFVAADASVVINDAQRNIKRTPFIFGLLLYATGGNVPSEYMQRRGR